VIGGVSSLSITECMFNNIKSGLYGRAVYLNIPSYSDAFNFIIQMRINIFYLSDN
jgi:hypothetical protein